MRYKDGDLVKVVSLETDFPQWEHLVILRQHPVHAAYWQATQKLSRSYTSWVHESQITHLSIKDMVQSSEKSCTMCSSKNVEATEDCVECLDCGSIYILNSGAIVPNKVETSNA